MADDKPNGNADLLVQAIRRVHREQVEGVKRDALNEPATTGKEIERQIEQS